MANFQGRIWRAVLPMIRYVARARRSKAGAQRSKAAMILDQEQAMTTPPVYSQFLPCLYDQAQPVGDLGRGTHYSVFRSIEWRELDGDFRDSGRFHDFAVVWDEDHDTRIVSFVERLHTHGLLWPIVFIGERKGVVTILLWSDVDPTVERGDWYEVVKELAENADECDVWTADFGRFHRDPANREGRTDPTGIINDSQELVVTYLQTIDVLWQLGEKKRAVYKPISLPSDFMEVAGQ
ncbi:hypothetical protein ACBY01_07210 [Sphingomonas sp. ac-8]|uniref:hypothetical protein n=1 Tax=Sphingomonas sp. ac-8 TaxID=3242977 RepID=UPI003A80055B